MIITQTPFRMSFFGGGTDMESFFRENGGAVLSTTFDKYCYVNVRHLPRFFDYSTELSYSKTERVTCIEDIQHPAIRNAMKMLDMHEIRLSHPYDSGLIIANKNGSVEKWLAKEDERPQYYRNRVNAGLHVINPKVLEFVNIDVDSIGKIGANGKPVKVDLDRQLLKPLAGTGKMFCYDSPEYVKDMGTPERYYFVCNDCKEGRIAAKNLKNKQKAIFLDRDGTINKYVGFLRNIDDFELIDGVAEAIRKINESGYLAIVVTNQPVIARGEVSFEELEEIHNKMETLLGKEGAYLDAIYYCPHHPHKGYEGERPELKIDCDCRKPKPGMLLKATADFNIDLSQSWMVGDGENDVKAGLNAGCKTALIGQGKENIGQLVSEKSLLEFVKNSLQ